MYSSVLVYATLQRQSARFRCRSPTSSPSTLHVSWARTGPCTMPLFQEPTRSWWGCYLNSSVPSVVVVYATLRRQSARFRCRPPASSPSTLHVSWARTSSCAEPRFQEPTRSCFLLAFYAKLSQSSPESDRSLSPLCAPQPERGKTLWGFKDERTSPSRPVFTPNKHHENSLVNPTYAWCESSFTPELSSLLLVTSVRFPLFLWVQHHYIHPKTLFEIAMVLSTNSGSFPSNSLVSVTFSILLRFGESWNPIAGAGPS